MSLCSMVTKAMDSTAAAYGGRAEHCAVNFSLLATSSLADAGSHNVLRRSGDNSFHGTYSFLVLGYSTYPNNLMQSIQQEKYTHSISLRPLSPTTVPEDEKD